MEHVVLIIHLMLAVSLIGLILLQRSEGGGLGIGGSGGLGGFATPGGTASVMTRATAIVAFCFFTTSLVLGILAGKHSGATTSIMDKLDTPAVVKTVDEAVPVEVPVDVEEGAESSVPVE